MTKNWALTWTTWTTWTVCMFIYYCTNKCITNKNPGDICFVLNSTDSTDVFTISTASLNNLDVCTEIWIIHWCQSFQLQHVEDAFIVFLEVFLKLCHSRFTVIFQFTHPVLKICHAHVHWLHNIRCIISLKFHFVATFEFFEFSPKVKIIPKTESFQFSINFFHLTGVCVNIFCFCSSTLILCSTPSKFLISACFLHICSHQTFLNI